LQRLVRREEHEQAGVGLTTCKRIVEAHGGRIQVQLEVSQRSTFSPTVPETIRRTKRGRKKEIGRRVRPVNILLVEDNPDDVEITRRALEKGQARNELTVARDGQQALDILFGCQNGHNPRPDLILLDLNLPGVDGREVLAKVKADPDLRRIPVVGLTVSTREEDITLCYDLGVNTFISKPARFEDFIVIATLPSME
jgi:chemotaxis family two-component system response regulator Rcp1